MDTQNTKNQISSVFPKALLQKNKGINFNGPIEKNTKPMSLYDGFVVFKPKSRCDVCTQFASFWLECDISGLK